ncbi:MAG: xanthine permease, partial [Anaerolineales bacterium]|nr:xanthine permease [Anaerolineales bacterium]
MTTTARRADRVVAYLPNDAPPLAMTVVLGFQHVLTMFPATVLVALLVGFDVGTVLTVSGAATVVALVLSRVISGQFIPLYYGSSFSYIAATQALTKPQFATYAGSSVRLAQVGIVATGVVNVIVGFLVRLVGKRALDRVLPPVITGSVAMVIGISLAFTALDMANAHWGVALITFFVTVILSVYLQNTGFIGLLPVLLGGLVGYLVSIPFGLVDPAVITSEAWLRVPKFTLPAFGDPRAWSAVATIAVIAIATIPESTAHLYQISLYVDQLADRMHRERYRLDRLIGLNLILDGVGDFINGMFGGVAGTNYGENNSLMVITRNYSGPSLIAAGIIA